jgi:hypothetical protein
LGKRNRSPEEIIQEPVRDISMCKDIAQVIYYYGFY